MLDDLLQFETDAPVLGMNDVALGRWVPCPMTVYLERNRDRSGVMGVLMPNGEFIAKTASTTGLVVTWKDDDGEMCEALIQWDGAQPSPISPTPIGYQDAAQSKPIFQESSKGILLGDYPNTGELWRAIGIGRRMADTGKGTLWEGRTHGVLGLDPPRDQ